MHPTNLLSGILLLFFEALLGTQALLEDGQDHLFPELIHLFLEFNNRRRPIIAGLTSEFGPPYPEDVQQQDQNFVDSFADRGYAVMNLLPL